MKNSASRFLSLREPARSMTGDISAIVEEVRSAGFSFAPAAQIRALLTPAALAEWPSFAASWDDLGVDTYMADGGRYRRRRFAAFAVSAEGVVRKAHQPHYQSRDYNPLNGGIERWFGPVTEAVAAHPVTLGLLDVGRRAFDALTPTPDRPQAWHVELHQFRIEALAGQIGQPTPEGLHRDGVDWVLVVLVDRKNVESGVTSIYDLDHRHLGDFTLVDPLDSVFLQDNRVFHGVTAIRALEPDLVARRDVAVITFRAEPLRLPSPD
ncbi:2OG-Fe dioxygenase family protein [Methylocapsa polymorpha]|uniref:2OG-Fe dioxygenase family protein n=1 Tax=Methylocapsa polymorpha TaxID=3080828 RepID=A0ABZ0HUL8_9HYPH|nr:2OG-Fe dioxygenase family protein [Methylocapsa sp. RX1]